MLPQAKTEKDDGENPAMERRGPASRDSRASRQPVKSCAGNAATCRPERLAARACFPRRLFVPLRLEQVHRQRRNERPREDVRGHHGKHHRLGQRDKEVARDAGKQEHRHEDDADAKRGDKGGHGDLARAVENAVMQILPLARDAGRCFRSSTVASSTRIPTARASPPSVMMLIVSPSALSRE